VARTGCLGHDVSSTSSHSAYGRPSSPLDCLLHPWMAWVPPTTRLLGDYRHGLLETFTSFQKSLLAGDSCTLTDGRTAGARPAALPHTGTYAIRHAGSFTFLSVDVLP
jgi:hypothetical protein